MRFFKLALQMLVDVPYKSLGTLLGVFISAFLMLQELSSLQGLLTRVAAVPDTAQVDIWIASKATESIGATDSVPESRVGAAAGTPGVAWSAPVVLGMGRVTRPDGVRECVSVLGVKTPRYAGLPSRLAPGTSPRTRCGAVPESSSTTMIVRRSAQPCQGMASKSTAAPPS